MSDYRRVLSAFYGTPWAIERAKFEEIEAVLLDRAAGGHLSDEEIRARIGTGQRPAFGVYDIEADALLWAAADGTAPATSGRQVVSVVGIYGALIHRAGMFTNTSGLTSAEAVAQRMRAAAADPSVRGIVLDVDSPGGVVHGIPELASAIREARSAKPVAAVANARAGSAAYWAYAQATPGMAYVTPSGLVGSVGVFVEHADISEANAKAGIKVTTIAYGKNKALGSPNAPLSEDARAELERQVGEFGKAFEADVAKGRDISVELVRKSFGQGLMFTAKDAIERGMADDMMTLDEAVRRMAGRRQAAAVAAEAPASGEARAVATHFGPELAARRKARARLRGMRA